MRSDARLDSHVRSANFESLQQTFFYETGAVGAARLVRPYGSSRRLDWLLRDHTEKEVSDLAEIHLRDLFDDLFGFYSLVEIGAQIATVPDPLPRAFQTTALRILTNPACRAYFAERYPLPLPQALLRRLDPEKKSGVPLTESGQMDIAIQRFQELLAFELRFRSDDEITVMLRLLDGFTIGGVKLAPLIEFAKNVENYQAAVSSQEYKRDARARALRGSASVSYSPRCCASTPFWLTANCAPCCNLPSRTTTNTGYGVLRLRVA